MAELFLGSGEIVVMNRRHYRIELPLEGSGQYYTVCVADTIEACIAVIDALLRAGCGSPGEIRIIAIPID